MDFFEITVKAIKNQILNGTILRNTCHYFSGKFYSFMKNAQFVNFGAM